MGQSELIIPNDDDNPIVTCTIRQLAFVAWQKRFESDDLARSGPSWERFVTWWDGVWRDGFPSIRQACEEAWRAARPVLLVGDCHPNSERLMFNAWWQAILDARPVIGTKPA